MDDLLMPQVQIHSCWPGCGMQDSLALARWLCQSHAACTTQALQSACAQYVYLYLTEQPLRTATTSVGHSITSRKRRHVCCVDDFFRGALT